MTRATARWLVLSVLALTAAAIVIVWPSDPERYLPDFIPWPEGRGVQVGDFERETVRLGLDLRGGTHVVLEADPPPDFSGDLDQALERNQRIIEQRVNEFGVAETEIQRQGSDRLSVQLPGVTPEEAAQLIGRTAVLEFREPKTNEAGEVAVLVPTTPEGGPTLEEGGDGEPAEGEAGATPTPTATPAEGPEEVFVPLLQAFTNPAGIVWLPATGTVDGRPVALTGRFLESAGVDFDFTGQPVVALDFTKTGGDLFEQITRRLLGDVGDPNDNLLLGIFLDDELLSAPRVRSAIGGGQAVIEGDFTIDSARELAAQLDAGALAVPMRVVQQQEVDATLGEDTVVRTVEAGGIALLVIVAFMVLYYRLPGLLASAALVTYVAVVLAVFKLVPVTITLAGIAGFVLSVGMAVDANILIFERTKEELRLGRRLREAVSHGFSRAWPSIFYSNSSTLITTAILWWFGDQFQSSLVKGFALTLGIGVLVSMFTAITVTRTYLTLLVGTRWARRLWLFGVTEEQRQAAARAAVQPLTREEHRPRWLDFVGRRPWFFLGSGAALLVSVIALAVPPALQLGIDFTGGTTFTIEFQKPVAQEGLRAALSDLGHAEARVQGTGGGYLVQLGELRGLSEIPPVGPIPPSERDDLEFGLEQRFGPFGIRNFETVTGVVSREIWRNAGTALAVAAAAILLYVSWSFRNVPRPLLWGAAAIIALAHDTLIVFGAFALLGKLTGTDVNAMFITGLLTVVGFSVHDTIVVFDRIRENLLRRSPDEDLAEVVNDSLIETLARSVNTSATVVFAALALLLLGGPAIQSLLLVLLIGIVSGTYSSIAIAAQILVTWEKGDLGRLVRGWLPRPQPAA